MCTRLELTSVFEQITIALERGHEPKALFTAFFDYDRAQIVAVKQDSDMNALRCFKFTNQFSGQFGGLLKGMRQNAAILFLDVQPDAQGNGIASKADRGGNELMAANGFAGERVFDPADRFDVFAAFLFLGIVDNEFDGFAFGGCQQGQ